MPEMYELILGMFGRSVGRAGGWEVGEYYVEKCSSIIGYVEAQVGDRLDVLECRGTAS